ncbi:NYN domain-containing protein [Stieleria sp. JC731]|uniref:NYN domain-containing protein n=1 Tax=Pirellulaceae TaxID=2691357 RepID=UPI001E3E6C07|nr:NYN domain-containing protein [Stieleria sp. JC731]MCC9600053.1 NYN domain-containing protein [Stieleria sp. JC731]
MGSAKKLAVLIDADNFCPNLCEPLMRRVAQCGEARVKRAYGDWTSTGLSSWKSRLNKYAISPVQQFRYTTGKNSTDACMIIDAMDLLYTQKLDGFCLVTSDSDFTRLAIRIRESELVVFGIGEQKSPSSLMAACDKFFIVGKQAQDTKQSEANTPATKAAAVKKASKATAPKKDPSGVKKASNHLRTDGKLVNLLRDAIKAKATSDGWATCSAIGNHLGKGFSPKTYSHATLSKLIKAVGLFECRRVKAAGSQNSVIYFRNK